MNKLIFAFCSSFFLLIFIWTIVGYMKFGPDLVNKHFDFKSTIENLTSVFSWKGPDLIDLFERVRTAFTLGDGGFGTEILEFLRLFSMPFELVYEFVVMFADVIISLLKFIFQPKFI